MTAPQDLSGPVADAWAGFWSLPFLNAPLTNTLVTGGFTLAGVVIAQRFERQKQRVIVARDEVKQEQARVAGALGRAAYALVQLEGALTSYSRPQRYVTETHPTFYSGYANSLREELETLPSVLESPLVTEDVVPVIQRALVIFEKAMALGDGTPESTARAGVLVDEIRAWKAGYRRAVRRVEEYYEPLLAKFLPRPTLWERLKRGRVSTS